ncbi:alpha/beta fold hydrolase [Streptomyces sp. NPDC085927]|uniref:alpha/beta fold hydrolase n=1 Tax=Streptomyces sp. NPDC085927 TaxID=3365738 RepID=UPI0037D69F7C
MGPPHGGALTAGPSFGAVPPALPADRLVLAPEVLGHGRTAGTDRALPVPEPASGVVALLDAIRVEQADFLGYSLGGLTALSSRSGIPAGWGRACSPPPSTRRTVSTGRGGCFRGRGLPHRPPPRAWP